MKNFTPIFTLLLSLLSLTAIAQTARVQVIHNSPDAAATEVDVYLNGTLLLNDFAFRTATPFVDAPAGTPIAIVVAPGNSTSDADGIYTLNTTLTENETYILVANGLVSTMGYSPLQPFELSVFAGAREMASDPSDVDMLVNHGSTDAPTVDVVETSVPVGTVVNDISYPEFEDAYLELIPGDYVIDITDATGTTVVDSYLAPLETLGLEGSAITVLASGFVDPSMNSDGPAFGLWVATAAGGELIPLPLANQTARVQVIHNAADMAAQLVDIYLNGMLVEDDFAFRTATPFVDVPAGVEISIDVAPSTSTSAAESIYNLTTTLEADETYMIVANGIVSATGYSPNDPFQLYVYNMGREAATTGTNTDVLVFHGATDAPTVDVTANGAGTLVNDIMYGDFSNGYLELPTADYVLNVTTADGTITVASYEAPLETLSLDGASITVLASGFLDPSMNSDGPAFGLWVATAAGGELIALPTVPLSNEVFENSEIVIYPNPATKVVNINIPDNTLNTQYEVFDMSGRKVLPEITGNSMNVSSLQEGIYMLQLNIDGNISQHRIVVKK